MGSFNELIDGIIRRLNAHKTRHQKDGADELDLAGLSVAAADILAGILTGMTMAGVKFISSEKTSNYTITSTDLVIYVDASSTTATITLPAAASSTNQFHYVKKVDSSGNSVIIEGNGKEKIDGEENITLNLQYSYIAVHCDGDEWFILGGEYVKMDDLLRRILSELKDLIEIAKATKDEVKEINK